MNQLFYGDCLPIMQELKAESIDLIYLDPPFNSNRAYHAIYTDSTGHPLPEQVEGFNDIWTLDAERREAILNMPVLMRKHGINDGAAELWKWISALENSQPRLLAYLSYMVERLLVTQTLLKSTGSIYLHCDPTASHYIKIIMDTLFGDKHFINEIVWCYTGPRKSSKAFSKKHDIILSYAKSKDYEFNPQKIAHKSGVHNTGQVFGAKNAKQPDKKLEMENTGKSLEDWWVDIWSTDRYRAERLGYPTQKPLALMERIIKASSNEGDVVLDPFCGCATTLVAAEVLNRKWIGIDIAYHAIKRVVRKRLKDVCKLEKDTHYEVSGIPVTREAAIDLWKKDTYQFQRWAVEQVNGFVSNKRTADGGIDGRIYFKLIQEFTLGSMILEVKGGENIGIKTIKEFIGVVEKEKAVLGGLIIRGPLGETQLRNFKQEMASIGKRKIVATDYDAIQLLTLDDILSGKKFDTPLPEGKLKGAKQEVMEYEYT